MLKGHIKREGLGVSNYESSRHGEAREGTTETEKGSRHTPGLTPEAPAESSPPLPPPRPRPVLGLGLLKHQKGYSL